MHLAYSGLCLSPRLPIKIRAFKKQHMRSVCARTAYAAALLISTIVHSGNAGCSMGSGGTREICTAAADSTESCGFADWNGDCRNCAAYTRDQCHLGGTRSGIVGGTDYVCLPNGGGQDSCVGYIPTTDTSTCTCPGGSASRRSRCQMAFDYGRKDGISCISCDVAGYQVQESPTPSATYQMCVDASGHAYNAKPCSCANGVPPSGLVCSHGATSRCASCNTGYSLQGTTCTPVPVPTPTPTPTPTPLNCNVGYGVSGGACVQCGADQYSLGGSSVCQTKSCTCENGAAAQGVNCDTHGSPQCTSCNAGYGWDAGSKVCTACPAGTVSAADTQDACSSCEPAGLRRPNDDQSACVDGEAICSCQYGIGATGAACPVHGSHVCASCGQGYTLFHNKCKLMLSGTYTIRPANPYTCNRLMARGSNVSNFVLRVAGRECSPWNVTFGIQLSMNYKLYSLNVFSDSTPAQYTSLDYDMVATGVPEPADWTSPSTYAWAAQVDTYCRQQKGPGWRGMTTTEGSRYGYYGRWWPQDRRWRNYWGYWKGDGWAIANNYDKLRTGNWAVCIKPPANTVEECKQQCEGDALCRERGFGFWLRPGSTTLGDCRFPGTADVKTERVASTELLLYQKHTCPSTASSSSHKASVDMVFESCELTQQSRRLLSNGTTGAAHVSYLATGSGDSGLVSAALRNHSVISAALADHGFNAAAVTASSPPTAAATSNCSAILAKFNTRCGSGQSCVSSAHAIHYCDGIRRVYDAFSCRAALGCAGP